jgi:hypothetical protein
MAFQLGTQIRPELANADLSGFQRAAEINAQMLAQLGQDIGEGIQSYQKNKQITSSSLAQIEGIAAANPDAYAALKQGGGDIAKSIKNIEEGNYKQKDTLSVLGALGTFVSEKDRQRQINLEALKAQDIKAGTDIKKKQIELMGQPTPTKPTAAMSNYNALREMGVPHEEALDRSFKSGGPQTVVNVGGQGPQKTKTQQKIEENLATDVANWESGGRAQAVGNLQTMKGVMSGLASGSIDTRTTSDFIPDLGGLRDSVGALVNPSGQDAIDNIRLVVFQNLKETLGNQFTAQEAQQLVNATYNRQLSEQQNLDRLFGVLSVMENVMAAKDALSEHLRSGKSIESYEAPKPIDVYRAEISNLSDLNPDLEDDLDSAIQDIAKKYSQ